MAGDAIRLKTFGARRLLAPGRNGSRRRSRPMAKDIDVAASDRDCTSIKGDGNGGSGENG